MSKNYLSKEEKVRFATNCKSQYPWEVFSLKQKISVIVKTYEEDYK